MLYFSVILCVNNLLLVMSSQIVCEINILREFNMFWAPYGHRQVKYLHGFSTLLLFCLALASVYNWGRSYVLFVTVNANAQNNMKTLKYYIIEMFRLLWYYETMFISGSLQKRLLFTANYVGVVVRVCVFALSSRLILWELSCLNE